MSMDKRVGERVYGTGGDHASLLQHGEVVRGMPRKRYVLLNEDDRHADLAIEPDDDLFNLLDD